MARNKSPKTKNLPTKAENATSQNETGREAKILNAMANTSVILMSTMMGAFTKVMVDSTSALASGMAEAFGGKDTGKEVDKEIKQDLPQIDEKMAALISDIRKDIYAQMSQKRSELAPLLCDPSFDVGPEIIEKYNFNLPRLTEELDDNALAQYSQLLANEDADFVKMFSDLAQWLNSLPKPPEKTRKKPR